MKLCKKSKPYLLLTIFLLSPMSLPADIIAIIGTGQVAGALGPEFSALGHTIIYGSREPTRADVKSLVNRTGNGATATTPADAVSTASIVVMAVPGLMVEQITKSLGDLGGKIIIDPTNPLIETEDGLLGLDTASSNSEVIQSAAPDAMVVKAFNTLNWSTMVDPAKSGGPVSIPLAGNNAEAKAKVAELVTGMGLEPIDVGPLKHARYVEGMLVLWINNQYKSNKPFDFYLRKQL